MNEEEFKDMNGGATGTPTFAELDTNKDDAIDADEIQGYPGCEH